MPALGSRNTADMSRTAKPRASRKQRGALPAPSSSSSMLGGENGPPTPENSIRFDAGWRRIERELITPLRDAVAASRADAKAVNRLFPRAQFTGLYTHIYTMCTQKAPRNWSGKLYFEYKRWAS